MAIALVQSAKGFRTTAGPLAVTFGSSVTEGNTIVVTPGCVGSVVLFGSVIDSQGNTYTNQAQMPAGNNSNVAIFTTVATATGTLTVTSNIGAGGANDLIIEEFSGVAVPTVSGSGVGTNASSTNSITVAPPIVSTSSTGAVILVKAYNSSNSSTWAFSPADYTIDQYTANTDGSGHSLMSAYTVVTGPGTYGGETLTASASTSLALVTITLVAASSTPGGGGTGASSFSFASHGSGGGGGGGGGGGIPSPAYVYPVGINGQLVSKLNFTTLNGFPMLFLGVFSFLKSVSNGGQVQSPSGYDIWFSTDTYGQDVIPFERVKWDPATGTVLFWVQTPPLNWSGTYTIPVATVYLNVGANIPTDLQQKNQVWDTNYVLVMHGGDGTTLSLLDSTAYANNGAGIDVVASAGAAGWGSDIFSYTGGGIAFNGDTSEVEITSASLGITEYLTISVVQIFESIKSPGAAIFGTIGYGLFANPGDPTYIYARYDGTESIQHAINTGEVLGGSSPAMSWATFPSPVGNVLDPLGINTASVYTMTIGGFVFTGTNLSNPWTAPAIQPGEGLVIGQAGGNPFSVNPWLGTLTEIRVSKIMRSNDWMSTEGQTYTFPGSTDTAMHVGWFYTVLPSFTPSLSISCGSPPNGVVGVSYIHTLPIIGGVAPYTITITSGVLPPGLTLTGSIISGTPTTAGTYPFTATVTDSASNTAHVSCSITITSGGGGGGGGSSSAMHLTCCDNDIYFDYIDTGGNSVCLRYEIPRKRWFLHHYGDAIVTHYLAESTVSGPNTMDIWMPSRTQNLIYKAGGNTDNNAVISTIIQTPSFDNGDQRAQKLYVDVMMDTDGAGPIEVAAFYNNDEGNSPVLNITAPGYRQQQILNISSLADLTLYRNLSLKFSWTGGPAGPQLYAIEPSGFLQPYLSTFFVTQFIPFSFPGWKSMRRMFPALISTAAVLMTIKTQDGRTYGPFTIPSTAGQYRIIPQMLSHGIKDLAFALQLDGQGTPFAFFPGDFTAEVKDWVEEQYIKLAMFRA